MPLAVAAAELAGATPPAADKKAMPQIHIGNHTLSRLICGSNPFHAGSHLSIFFNKELSSYYTPEQILKTLRRCEEAGINTWQSGLGLPFDLYHRYLAEGGKMQFLAIDGNQDNIVKLAKGGCIGVAHHGEATDGLFKAGKLDQVGEFLKRARQSGIPIGVSTHMPDVVDAIESKGWDLDYYMTCIYERHRSEADLKKLLGHVPIAGGRGLSEERPAANVQGDPADEAALPGVQDPRRRPPLRASPLGRAGVPRDAGQHQAGRRHNHRHLRSL